MELERLKFWIVVPQVATNYVKKPCAYSLGNTTGYLSTGAGTLSQSTDEDAVYSRRWGRCLKVACTNTADGVEYGKTKGWGVPVTNTKKYTFSVDVIDLVAGEDLSLLVKNAGGTVKASLAFKSTGYWQRPSVTVTADATATNWRIEVRREAGQGTGTFYCTGFQFEDGEEATTFFDGYTTGFGYSGYPEFWFEGTRNGSYSHRSNKTRAGGRLLEINTDHRRIIAAEGLGFGAFDSIATPMVTGGEVYQTHIHKSRTIAFVIAYDGNNQGEMQALRDELLSAVRPDYFGDQPMIIRYQGFDVNGAEATDPVDIVCVFQPSHESTPPTPVFQKDMLVFKVLDGYFEGAFHEGIELDQYEDFTHADYIMGRDAEDGWFEMEGMTGSISAILPCKNRSIIAGGFFTQAGGDIRANAMAKWNGTAWVCLDPNYAPEKVKAVSSMVEVPNGDVYIGAIPFTGEGLWDALIKYDGTHASYVLKGYDPDFNPDNVISCMALDKDGLLYFAGRIRDDYFWTYNVNTSEWITLPEIIGVKCMAWDRTFSKLYLGGSFLNKDGTLGDYLCYYSPADNLFHSLSAMEPNNKVNAIVFDEQDNLIIGGEFTEIGSEPINYIAKWNGSYWSEIGGGVNGKINQLWVSGNKLYAAGNFTTAGGVVLTDKIAVYTNNIWMPLDIDLPGTKEIRALAFDEDGTLYIGGDFTGTARAGKVALNIVNNTGNANIYPVIQLHGPGTLHSIANRTTGKSIQFNNLTLLNGEWLNLFLDPVNLRMTSSWDVRGSVLDYVLPGSDYGSFYLTPGVNRISLFMDVTSPTDCWMIWKPKYWNIERAAHV